MLPIPLHLSQLRFSKLLPLQFLLLPLRIPRLLHHPHRLALPPTLPITVSKAQRTRAQERHDRHVGNPQRRPARHPRRARAKEAANHAKRQRLPNARHRQRGTKRLGLDGCERVCPRRHFHALAASAVPCAAGHQVDRLVCGRGRGAAEDVGRAGLAV